MKLKLKKSHSNRSGHLSRKVMLSIYSGLIGTITLALASIAYLLAVGTIETVPIAQKQISVDEQKVEELKDYEYLGRYIDIKENMGKEDPFKD
jgi:hypothetical protein